MAKLKHLLDAPQSRWEHIEFMRAWAKDYLFGEGYSRFDLETYSYDPTQGRCGWRHLSLEQLDELLRKYPKGRNEGKRVKPDAIIGAAWRVYATSRHLLENGHDDRAYEIFLSESHRLETYSFAHSKTARAERAMEAKKSAEARSAHHQAVIDRHQELLKTQKPRSVAGILAREFDLTNKQIRNILKKK